MPRRQAHAVIVFILLLLPWFVLGTKRYLAFAGNWTFLISFALFLVGSLAPDYIEPAYNFTHRSFFHSWKLLKIISILTITTAILWIIIKFYPLLFIAAFLAGYIGHLLLDSTTKMGLPSGDVSTNLIKDKK